MSCWYCPDGFHDDVVMSTRIRLARNIKNIPFPSKMLPEQFETVNEMVKNVIFKSSEPIVKKLKYISMNNVPEIERFAMVERHIISKKFALNYKNRSIIISDDESICIMLGEEDHIRIQVLSPNLSIKSAYETAEIIDKILCNGLEIAFDNRVGFLTECPTNLGTGLRASVMLHLPMLEQSGEISSLLESIGKIGFTVRGMYGEGTKALASLYQISNQVTLGISEETAIDNLKIIATQLKSKEEEYRKKINVLKLEDSCMRSYGILKNARILTSNELLTRISEILLGMSVGVIKLNIWPMSILIEGQPYMIMKKAGEMSAQSRDVERANMVRNLL